ncbi:transposase [Salinibacter ruber]|uniref:transposase n=1 Tax=Salinibacter ruber TaxID=146919 RepID=UPI003C6E55D5
MDSGCRLLGTFYHGVKHHVIAGKRSDKLLLLNRAGMTPGSENDPQALRRVLPTLEGGVLCGDKVYCEGPLKERLTEGQNLDLLTPIKKKRARRRPRRPISSIWRP